jgi:hypothetical protein
MYNAAAASRITSPISIIDPPRVLNLEFKLKAAVETPAKYPPRLAQIPVMPIIEKSYQQNSFSDWRDLGPETS